MPSHQRRNAGDCVKGLSRPVAGMLLSCAALTALAAMVSVAASGNGGDARTAPVSDFSPLEPGERLPGGATTHDKALNQDAFSHASANLPFAREFDFKIGNGIFKKLWVSAPASTKSSDGLGPLYNARACQRCHLKDGRGHPPEANWPEDDQVSMFLRLSVPPRNKTERRAIADNRIDVVPEPTYGGQLQDFAIQGHAAEGRMHIEYQDVPVELADGEAVTLRKPTYSITDLGYGPLDPETMMSPRVANPMLGLGLIEAIAADDIRARADPDDADGDGISGRAREVWSLEHDELMLGRFGWKAGAPSVREQAAGAFAGDIGLSTRLRPRASGDCTGKQTLCTDAPDGNGPGPGDVEVGNELFDLVVFYSRNLALPPRRDADSPDVLAGKNLFHESGCASCHRPKYLTGDDDRIPDAQRGQLIWPYSDLLLHDMGEGLADNRPEGNATGREWRTPPLWGIGLTGTVSGHTYFLHDGRARSLLEAILWHGGEAEAARQRVIAMSRADRDRLIAFLNSL